jgi:hypothetical protein
MSIHRAAKHAATVDQLRDEPDALDAMNFLNVAGLTPHLCDAGGEDDQFLGLERLGLVSVSHDEGDEETGPFARSVGRR